MRERAGPRPLLSVLVPAFDERSTIEELIREVVRVPIPKEILVVDDGSTDGTREILERLARELPDLRLIAHEEKRGKGSAVRTAIPHLRGRITIIQDADLEYVPDDYPFLIAPILEGRTSVVYGSRPLHPDNRYPLDLFRIGSWVVTQAANLLYRCRLTDEPTGYKVFRTELLASIRLRCRGFEFCPEVTAKVRKRGERILEVPIRYRRRTVADGKKIRARDAIVALWTLVRYRIGAD
jgi:dolichol-phosphate mannosyltransferase